MTLLILAGGLGSRFGGEKQFTGVGPANEFLLEFTIYDAVQNGFDRIVLITKAEATDTMYTYFRERVPDHVEVVCVAQRINDLPQGKTEPEDRAKPWGTAHAVWAARDVIDSQFAIVNADDFYGCEGVTEAGNLSLEAGKEFGIVAYQLANTTSPHGTVSRGVCAAENGLLKSVTEYTKIGNDNGELVDQVSGRRFDGTEPTSMNLWVVDQTIFPVIEQALSEQLDQIAENKGELYLPVIIQQMIDSGDIQVRCKQTSSDWAGLTYAEDQQALEDKFAALTSKGDYPSPLWGLIPQQVLNDFNLIDVSQVDRVDSGLINETYVVTSSDVRYVLQRLNPEVFPNPLDISQNIELVHKALENEDDYHVPEIMKTIRQEPLVKSEGSAWRLMRFVEGSQTLDRTSDPAVAREAGRILGVFHAGTSTVATTDLKDTLPKFHDVPTRVQQFREAIEVAEEERSQSSLDQRQQFESMIEEMLGVGFDELPVRVVHNDTKLNNILFDADSGKAMCLIDLDTVMPGYLLHDFGDALRTLCNTCEEDNPVVDQVTFDLGLFKAFCDGYFKKGAHLLTDAEWNDFPKSVKLMPFIMGLRFLTDYLLGDRYYRITHTTQNLDRCTNQLALLDDIERNFTEIQMMINSYRLS